MSGVVNKRKISNLMKQRETIDDVPDTIKLMENKIIEKVTNKEEKKSLIERLDDKIDKLNEKKVIAEMKKESYKIWFDVFNLCILFLSAILTIVEAVKNNVRLEEIKPAERNFFKIVPLLISTIIGLLTAIIKFKRYQDKLENNTKAIEKSIFTAFRMKKLQEDLHFADEDAFIKIREIYKEEIFPLYNQSQEELEGTLLHKDVIKYAAIKKSIENKGKKKILLLEACEKKMLDKAKEQQKNITEKLALPQLESSSTTNDILEHVQNEELKNEELKNEK
jgi:hypothetical protein